MDKNMWPPDMSTSNHIAIFITFLYFIYNSKVCLQQYDVSVKENIKAFLQLIYLKHLLATDVSKSLTPS